LRAVWLSGHWLVIWFLPFDPSASFNSLLLILFFLFLGVFLVFFSGGFAFFLAFFYKRFFLSVFFLCTIVQLLHRRPKLSPTAQLVTVLYIHSVVLARHHLSTLRPNNSRNLTAGFKQTDPLHATFTSHRHFPQPVPPLFTPCDALETVTG
jgi:hypothetical protein